jgi:leader peptidase (prepilin peptidase)/N-methyltransferase
VGALVGGGILWLIGEGYMQLRGREGMGLGDVKMMAMVGSFLGWKLAFLTIFLSALAGSLAGVAVALWIVIKRSLRWRRKGKDWATARQRAQASAQAFFTRLGIPYGVFLGTMAVVSWMWGLQWWQWYVGHFTQ